MTVKEAIAYLEDPLSLPEGMDTKDKLEWHEKAVSMAIEALKAQNVPDTNVEDTISRQAAIDAVKKNTFRLTFAEEQNCEGHVAWDAEAVYSEVMEGALLELPSAKPQYTEIAPEKAATEISCGSLAPAAYWLDTMIRLEQMGYVICRREKGA